MEWIDRGETCVTGEARALSRRQGIQSERARESREAEYESALIKGRRGSRLVSFSLPFSFLLSVSGFQGMRAEL